MTTTNTKEPPSSSGVPGALAVGISGTGVMFGCETGCVGSIYYGVVALLVAFFIGVSFASSEAALRTASCAALTVSWVSLRSD